MALDLNKPLRLVRNKKEIRNVSALQGRKNTYAYIYSDGDMEFMSSCRLEELENIPQSRWLNVYVSLTVVRPQWRDSRGSADKAADDLSPGIERVAVIEDKQDGSDWIVHKL